ncbi:hypothetical protein C8F01DRAFT_1257534 [Mycena amicta]|nr:hypothetical protein C8F01DRAFT_1257534 [Mycena amicta]
MPIRMSYKLLLAFVRPRLTMFHKLFATVFLALFVVAASASAQEMPVERALGDPCSLTENQGHGLYATQHCIGGICCLARKRGVLQTRGICLHGACP